MWLKFLFCSTLCCMQTFFGHTVFIKLLCECFSKKRIPTPYQPNPHDGGWDFDNIQYLIRLEKHICIYWTGFSFWKIVRKTEMEKCLKIFLGIFFRLLHCSNRTKRRLDAAVILTEFFMPKNSCKISAILICF